MSPLVRSRAYEAANHAASATPALPEPAAGPILVS
jgi:hypothetical protein